MRLPSLLIGILTVCLFTRTFATQLRTDVHLFQYAAVRSYDAEGQFEEFKHALREQIINLGQSFEQSVPEAARLELKQILEDGTRQLADPGTKFSSYSQMAEYWRLEGALAILTGRIGIRTPDSGFDIFSDVFLGQIGAQRVGKWVKFQLPLEGEFYDATKDSHAAAILYAFAMHLPPNDDELGPKRYRLLSHARLRACAVTDENEQIGKDILALVLAALEMDIPCQ